MLNFTDSKAMAKALRKGLAERHIDISHSDSLELVARQFGFANWNMLSARIDGAADRPKVPDSWIVGGGQPQSYCIGIDPKLHGVAGLKYIGGAASSDSGTTFATMMQSISAADFVGRTVRIRAELKSVDADRGALWMRVDAADGGRPLRFDNMHYRKGNGPLQGSVDWIERSVVLDVPEGAHSIHYGVMLSGGGELLARNLRFEEVDPSAVATTYPGLPRRPTNLGFGEAA